MSLVAAAALCSALGAAPADELDGRRYPWFVGTESLRTNGADGTRGLNRVDTAEPPAPGEVVVGLGSEYFSARGFLVAGDTTRRTTGRLTLGFSPLELLSVWASWEAVSGYNDRLTPRTTGYRGDPTLGVKVRRELSPGIDGAAALSIMIPTSAVGGGLEPRSGVYTARAIVSYEPRPGVVAALNIGYALDRSMHLFTRPLTSQERFAAGVYGVDSVLFGAGMQGLLAVTPGLATGGFLELTGVAPVGASDAPAPLRATLGVKALLPPARTVELCLGADVRVSGAPEPHTAVPGIPPWELFARLTGHWAAFAEVPAVAVAPLPPPPGCDEARPCDAGSVCEAGQCVVRAPEPAPPPTFQVTGKVVDKVSGAPVAGATVTVPGWAGPPVALDPAQATFTLGPIPVDPGLVQVRAEASGYRAADVTFPRGPAGSTREVTLELVPLARTVPGMLKGIISDARTGKPVRGTVTIPALKTRVKVDDAGTFAVELKAGRYDVLIASPRHVSQTKSVLLRPGDVVILNLDLTPRER